MHLVHRTLATLGVVFISVCTAAAANDPGADKRVGYYALQPSIVSNLSGGPRYIRCDVQLMTEQASEIPRIDLHSPALRHAILMLIAGQDGKQLLTRQGKEGLRMAALESVQDQLKELTGDTLVSDLYFTAYYVK